MNGLEKHLKYFPERIYFAFKHFKDWESITEIRLRNGLPLSLTGYSGNLFLSEKGEACSAPLALTASEKEIREVVSCFCKGDVYRYFDTLKDAFLMDEDGFRLGLCPQGGKLSSSLPESFGGINLRIPREIPDAANAILEYFKRVPLASTLLLSKPGAGKTTLLRALSVSLSTGNKRPPLRVAVIDEREELFPTVFRSRAGLCDILSGYPKARGIEIATRIFSPEVIVCDEIGSEEEAAALLSGGSGGALIFASAHAASLAEIRARPVFSKLLEAKLFSKVAILQRIPDRKFQATIRIEDLS